MITPSTATRATRSGPLAGLRVIEFAGLGPAPFACMMLSDMGAEVVTIDRPSRRPSGPDDITGRGRTLVLADLKNPQDRDRVLQLIEGADILIEGFRPGVMERLGLGPDAALSRNKRLVYGRMTGWGQSGPLAQAAGHDLNYIAITGALDAIGPAHGAPVPPLNLVGDYGGGALYLVAGVLAALHEAGRSGVGQVVDAAIVDGVASLLSLLVSHEQRGILSERRGNNVLDGGAPYYAVYQTADARYISLGSIEPAFFAKFCELTGLNPSWRDAQHDRAHWPALHAEIAKLFLKQPQAYWTSLLEGTDACFAPVLSLGEARKHGHMIARGTTQVLDGVPHPAPAPRFSRTRSSIQCTAPTQPVSLDAALEAWASP
ncbi:CaiB/BaiF CoA transferase family protein [Hydrogenophaga sp.]|uniref:CaiB/BaiF CoA transferase family protein n=1 Tax=Hydrogenophaga sp. TaxID=1904254 RepID=UPI0035B0D127